MVNAEKDKHEESPVAKGDNDKHEESSAQNDKHEESTAQEWRGLGRRAIIASIFLKVTWKHVLTRRSIGFSPNQHLRFKVCYLSCKNWL